MPLIRSPEPAGELSGELAAELTGFVPADTRPLLAATVVVLGLASMTVAAHLHTRWAGLRRLPMLGLHLGVCALTVLGGAALLGTGVLRPVRDAGWAGLVAGLLLGPAVGYAATGADRSVTRWWGRRAGHAVRDDRPVALRSGHARPAGVAVGGGGPGGGRPRPRAARTPNAPTPPGPPGHPPRRRAG
ncbi:hypothetical protein ABZ369_20645, partial [Streptomyces sp. NPDC005918]